MVYVNVLRSVDVDVKTDVETHQATRRSGGGSGPGTTGAGGSVWHVHRPRPRAPPHPQKYRCAASAYPHVDVLTDASQREPDAGRGSGHRVAAF